MQTVRVVDHRKMQGSLMTDMLIGVAAGALATWAMTKVDWAMYNREDEATRLRTAAARPGGMPPAQVAVTKAADRAGKPLTQDELHKYGQVVHYGLGIMPAMMYAAMYDRFPAMSKGRGSLFGLGVFLTQDELVNSVSGLGAKPTAYPWQAHARGLVAHIVFGMVTDAVVRMVRGAPRPDTTATIVPVEQIAAPTVVVEPVPVVVEEVDVMPASAYAPPTAARPATSAGAQGL